MSKPWFEEAKGYVGVCRLTLKYIEDAKMLLELSIGLLKIGSG